MEYLKIKHKDRLIENHIQLLDKKIISLKRICATTPRRKNNEALKKNKRQQPFLFAIISYMWESKREFTKYHTLLLIDSLNLFNASDSPPLKGVHSTCKQNLILVLSLKEKKWKSQYIGNFVLAQCLYSQALLLLELLISHSFQYAQHKEVRELWLKVVMTPMRVVQQPLEMIGNLEAAFLHSFGQKLLQRTKPAKISIVKTEAWILNCPGLVKIT